MATKKAATTAKPFVLGDALVHAFATNQRINLYLLEHLPDAAWRAATPTGKGREIAAMFAHMHNVRVMWLKACGAAGPLPEKADPETLSKQDAARLLDESARALEGELRRSLESGDGRVKGFKPDVASFFGYLVAHDAHHRGQVAMLARQAGHALPQSAMFGMWEWGTR